MPCTAMYLYVHHGGELQDALAVLGDVQVGHPDVRLVPVQPPQQTRPVAVRRLVAPVLPCKYTHYVREEEI